MLYTSVTEVSVVNVCTCVCIQMERRAASSGEEPGHLQGVFQSAASEEEEWVWHCTMDSTNYVRMLTLCMYANLAFMRATYKTWQERLNADFRIIVISGTYIFLKYSILQQYGDSDEKGTLA